MEYIAIKIGYSWIFRKFLAIKLFNNDKIYRLLLDELVFFHKGRRLEDVIKFIDYLP